MSDSDILSGLGIEPYPVAEACARLRFPEGNPLVSSVSLEFKPPRCRPGFRHSWTFDVEVDAEHWKAMEEHMRSGQPLSVKDLPAYVRGERWERGRVLFQIEVRG